MHVDIIPIWVGNAEVNWFSEIWKTVVMCVRWPICDGIEPANEFWLRRKPTLILDMLNSSVGTVPWSELWSTEKSNTIFDI